MSEFKEIQDYLIKNGANIITPCGSNYYSVWHRIFRWYCKSRLNDFKEVGITCPVNPTFAGCFNREVENLIPGHLYWIFGLKKDFTPSIFTLAKAVSSTFLTTPNLPDLIGIDIFDSTSTIVWKYKDRDEIKEFKTKYLPIINLTSILPKMKELSVKIELDKIAERKRIEEEKERKKYILEEYEKVKSEIVDLGYMNGWEDDALPVIYEEFKKLPETTKKDDLWLTKNIGRCCNEYINITRKFSYKIDSSD